MKRKNKIESTVNDLDSRLVCRRALYQVLLCYSIQELFYCQTLRTLVHNTFLLVLNFILLAFNTFLNIFLDIFFYVWPPVVLFD